MQKSASYSVRVVQFVLFSPRAPLAEGLLHFVDSFTPFFGALLDIVSSASYIAERDEQCLTFRRILQSCWHRVVFSLQKAKTFSGPDRRPQREMLDVVWVNDFAPKLEIRGPARFVDMDDIENLSERRYGHMCHWSGCHCHGGSSHPFRVCKGCWGAFYCNKKCQRR